MARGPSWHSGPSSCPGEQPVWWACLRGLSAVVRMLLWPVPCFHEMTRERVYSETVAGRVQAPLPPPACWPPRCRLPQASVRSCRGRPAPFGSAHVSPERSPCPGAGSWPQAARPLLARSRVPSSGSRGHPRHTHTRTGADALTNFP